MADKNFETKSREYMFLLGIPSESNGKEARRQLGKTVPETAVFK